MMIGKTPFTLGDWAKMFAPEDVDANKEASARAAADAMTYGTGVIYAAPGEPRIRHIQMHGLQGGKSFMRDIALGEAMKASRVRELMDRYYTRPNPIFVGFDEASKFSIEPGAVNRLGKEGVRWWAFEEKEKTMNFNIAAAANGGYIVTVLGGYRMTTDTLAQTPVFAGSLDDCLDYIRDQYEKVEETKAKQLEEKDEAEAFDKRVAAINEEHEKLMRGLYAEAGRTYHGRDY